MVLLKMKLCQNKELATELHKQIIRKFEKWKAQTSLADNIWVADFVDIQLISEFNKGIRFLLCIVDIFSKYAWVTRLKDKKGITITNAFIKIVNQIKYG